jgi:hypothetical protein
VREERRSVGARERNERQAVQDATARLLRDQETARRLVAMQASSQVAH